MRRELIHFREEDEGDFGRELNIYDDGFAEAENIDGIGEKSRYNCKNIGSDKANRLAKRLWNAMKDLEHQVIRDVDKLIIMRVNYKGKNKKIGFDYIDEAQNRKIKLLYRDFKKIFYELVKRCRWRK